MEHTMDLAESVINTNAVMFSIAPGVIITWNRSATFNVWHQSGDTFRNTNCFTIYGIETEQEAHTRAVEWWEWGNDDTLPCGCPEGMEACE